MPESSPDIAIFLPSLEGGGAERVMGILANAFVERGYTVELVLASAKGPYLGSIDDGVRIVDLATDGIARSALPLVRYLKQRRPQALLSALSHSNLVAALALAVAAVPTRLVISERLSLAAARKYGHGFRDRVIRALLPFAVRRADCLVVVAEAMIDEMESILNVPRSKMVWIPNPVVDEAMLADAAEPSGHPWLSGECEVPVVLGCGRLSAQKDFRTLIEAFRQVRDQREARLIILGEGEDRAALQQQIAKAELTDDVSLPGFVPNPFAYMSRAAVFALSSVYEGMPGALIQAIACGAPVVSTDCPTGPAEILQDGRWGCLVPMGNPQAMSTAIIAALDGGCPPATERARIFERSAAVTRYLEVLGFPSCASLR